MKVRNQIAAFICGFLFLFSLPVAGADETVIRILHVNDFHGFAEPYKPLGSDEMQGGISALSARVNVLRRERPSLLLSAGDMIQGNTWANLFEGASVIEMMNAMGFDAMVVGNHEFDFGQEVLRKRIAEARFPVLGANVQGLDSLKPYVIREIAGIRIAVIGTVTADTPFTTHPGNVAGLNFAGPAETVERLLKELRRTVDIVVVLSHAGYAADRAMATEVEGIDVIVGGHSHTKLERPTALGGTLIVQAWEHGKALGVLDLRLKDGKISSYEGHLEEIRPLPGSEDAVVQAIVAKYAGKRDAVLNEKVGEALVDLNGEDVRKRETNLGNLVADVIRRTAGADASIVNGGDIRTSIKKGDILMKDIYAVLPFNDYIVAIRLTGRQIREALEHGVAAVEEGSGRFPQVSGLSFTYDPSGKEGPRVKEITIGGKSIEPDTEYAVATNDFLAAGGDGYKVFGDAIRASSDFSSTGGAMKGDRLVYSDPGRWLKDVVAEHIRTVKSLAPRAEGRIKEIR